MARQNLNQARLSAATGIGTSTLSNRLAGHKPFLLDELDYICAALNVSIVEIIRRSESNEAA